MTEGSERDIHRDDIARTLQAGTVAANAVDQSLNQKADRSMVWVVAATAALISCAVSIAVAVPGAIEGARRDAVDASIAAQQAENRERADAAYEAAVAANEELERRGQPPVPVPRPSSSGDELETLVPAAVAGTLAALPEHVREPTAGEIASAIASYLRANPPPGPSPEQVASAVAAHLRANPPPVGPAGPAGPTGAPGPTGEAGRAPTEQEIQDAVTRVIAADPGLLCTYDGGQWVRLDGVVIQESGDPLPEQRTQTIFTCIPIPPSEREEPE